MATNERERRRTVGWWVGSVGILGVAGVLGISAGAIGMAIGAVLLAVRRWSSAIVAFIVGHIGLLLVPTLTTLSASLIAVEAGLACLLLESATRESHPWRTALSMAGAFSILAAVVASGWTAIEASWLVGVLLIAAMGTVAYSLHRYERLRLALVETA